MPAVADRLSTRGSFDVPTTIVARCVSEGCVHQMLTECEHPHYNQRRPDVVQMVPPRLLRSAKLHSPRSRSGLRLSWSRFNGPEGRPC